MQEFENEYIAAESDESETEVALNENASDIEESDIEDIEVIFD